MQRDAASVAHIRSELRSIKLDEDSPGDDLLAIAQQKLPALKSALAQTALDVLACNSVSVEPSTLQTQIARLLDANPPQPPPGSSVTNGDKHYAEWLAFGYGRNLLVSVGHLSPKLLSVTFTFHIPCGDDHLLIIFEPDLGHWRERLLWQAPPYKEISGAFGDGFFTALLTPSPGQWRLVAIHGRPWCTSRFSSFDMDVLAPTSEPTHPRVVWHTERGYSRTDYPETLKVLTPDTFEFRNNADAMSFDENAFERTVIYRYRLADDHVTRLEPIAMNARYFVDEWLTMPWNEAQAQDPSASPSLLEQVHALYHRDDDVHNLKRYLSWQNGPVRACKAKGMYQVEMGVSEDLLVTDKPGGDTHALPTRYFQLREGNGGYEMQDVRTAPNPACTGPNLMHDSGS